MANSLDPRPPCLLAWPLLALLLAAGCGAREEIRSYNVAKEAEPPPAAAEEPAKAADETSATAAAQSGEPTDRMLAAILPSGGRAWFFKTVGPIEAVDARAEEIEKFFASIRPGEAGRPTWELPADDWKEEQGSGMRAATIRIPAEPQPLELTVIPAMGDVFSNVNRWRGQMKLPPTSQEQLGDDTRTIEAGDATITVVDLRGRFDAGSAMMPPFARGAGGPAGPPQLPPGHPPIDDLKNEKDNGAPDGDR